MKEKLQKQVSFSLRGPRANIWPNPWNPGRECGTYPALGQTFPLEPVMWKVSAIQTSHNLRMWREKPPAKENKGAITLLPAQWG